MITSHLTRNEIAHNLSIFRGKTSDRSAANTMNGVVKDTCSLLRVFLWPRTSVVGKGPNRHLKMGFALTDSVLVF